METFENLGKFTGRGGAMSSMIGPGPAGSERLYVCYTYLSSLDLVAFDPANDQYQVWTSPQGGAWAMEKSPDHRLYLGTYFQGHILRLDPDSGKLEDLGQAIPGETYIWGLSLGPDGKLYGCTYPHAKLLQIDPVTGKMMDLGRMDPVQDYNRTLCAAPDGWVYCGIGSEKANLVAYNPQTKELRNLIPDGARDAGFGQVFRGEDGNAYGNYLGKFYRLKDGAATQVDHLPPTMPRNRLKDGHTYSDPGTYPGRSLPIFRLATGPDGKIYGSTILPEYLLRFNPTAAAPKPENLGLLPGAEAYSMLSAHNKLFIASYPGATLQVYDPARPFDPGTKKSNNPANYGHVAPEQDRPYDIAQAPDGKVYMACVPAYGHFGGAIAWYSPATDQVEYAPSPIPDQAIASLCALPDGRLVCGTSIEGGPGTRPRAHEAVLFVWDPAHRALIGDAIVFPGQASINNLCRGGDGLVYGSSGQQLFVFDPVRLLILNRTTIPQGSIARAGMITLDDGRVAVLAGSSALLVKYETTTWQIQEFAHADQPLTTGKAVTGGWLYAAADQTLLRARLPGK